MSRNENFITLEEIVIHVISLCSIIRVAHGYDVGQQSPTWTNTSETCTMTYAGFCNTPSNETLWLFWSHQASHFNFKSDNLYSIMIVLTAHELRFKFML